MVRSCCTRAIAPSRFISSTGTVCQGQYFVMFGLYIVWVLIAQKSRSEDSEPDSGRSRERVSAMARQRVDEGVASDEVEARAQLQAGR